MQTSYPLKIQAIRSPGKQRRLYVSFPLALAAAIGLDPGDQVQWELRIPINSDTDSNPIRTVIRDIRTAVGVRRRSGGTLKEVSELGQVFLSLSCNSDTGGGEFKRIAEDQQRRVV